MITKAASEGEGVAVAAGVQPIGLAGGAVAADADDLSGRDRLAWNVVASWGGHLVFIVAGFIMPRQIDRYIGQDGLGVWDFGWSAVNYFFLAQIGVGVSVNRYVAKYRSARDAEGLGRLISSVMLLQFAAAGIVLALTAATAMWLPPLFGQQLKDQAATATWVIALLGATVAIRTSTQAFSGVVTGCHRWDLHNWLNSASYASTVVVMLATLWQGGGLIMLSIVYVIGTIINEALRIVLAFRVCPELRVSVGRARWSEARALIAFGAKLSVIDGINVIVSQLTSMLVLTSIGVATLAVYSRLVALIRHTGNVSAKYSLPLTPMASSLQGAGRDEDVRELLISSTRFTAYLVWPILLALSIVGDDLLQVWMGPSYDPTWVLTFMALGSVLTLTQQPFYTILIGLNLHGGFSAIYSVSAILGLICSLIAVRWLHGDLLGLVAAGIVITNCAAVVVIIDTCRRLSIPVRRFFVRAYSGPMMSGLLFALLLLVINRVFDGHPALTLWTSALFGGCLLAPIYWRVAPPDMRARLRQTISAKIAALRLVVQPES
jgi:O-antigen/teichoic acid export membrane protein